MSAKESGFTGDIRPADAATEYDAMASMIRGMLGQMSTVTLARVKAVTNSGTLSPAGTVDLEPLVNLVDGQGKAYEHGVVYGCPYLRIQGGANAVIIDPVVGDIGIAAFADRDISSVIANKKRANPGSARRFDMADGLYIGGFLNGVPTQYVIFNGAGMKLVSPNKITIEAPFIDLNGTTKINGTLTGSSSITAPNVVGTTNGTFGNKPFLTHTHSSGGSGPPN